MYEYCFCGTAVLCMLTIAKGNYVAMYVLDYICRCFGKPDFFTHFWSIFQAL